MKLKSLPPPATEELDATFEARVHEYFSRMGSKDDFETWDIDFDRSHVVLESASQGPPARVTYRLTVTPNLTNHLGILHGGCAATLIDVLSTLILLGISRPGHFSLGGVSRNLKLTYLRPAQGGTEIRVICEVVHIGGRFALVKAEIRRVDNGELCIIAEHEKVNTDQKL